jgi:hypothetical protein
VKNASEMVKRDFTIERAVDAWDEYLEYIVNRQRSLVAPRIIPTPGSIAYS